MSTTEQHLKRIHDKLQQLLKQHAAVAKENMKLKEELEKGRQQSSQHQKTIEELRQQVNVMRMGAGNISDADKKEFEKRINGYLKEIDRCIAQLSE